MQVPALPCHVYPVKVLQFLPAAYQKTHFFLLPNFINLPHSLTGEEAAPELWEEASLLCRTWSRYGMRGAQS